MDRRRHKLMQQIKYILYICDYIKLFYKLMKGICSSKRHIWNSIPHVWISILHTQSFEANFPPVSTKATCANAFWAERKEWGGGVIGTELGMVTAHANFVILFSLVYNLLPVRPIH